MTTTSGPAWWASAFGTIIDGAGAVWVPAGCYDLCTLFKADSDFGSGRLVVQDTPRGFVRGHHALENMRTLENMRDGLLKELMGAIQPHGCVLQLCPALH